MTTFETICRAAEPAAAIRKLPDHQLHGLIRTLDAPASGIPALVHGMAEHEAARRWMDEHTDRPGAVGEGNS